MVKFILNPLNLGIFMIEQIFNKTHSKLTIL